VLLINKLTKPGDVKRISIYPDEVRVSMRDNTERRYRVVGTSPSEDKAIADNMRDYWANMNSGANPSVGA
jgi:hypothetical protein